MTCDFSRETKVLSDTGSERPEVPVEMPALAGSLKQESYHFSGERFNTIGARSE